MGKRKKYRFPQGINEIDRYYFPHRNPNPQLFPTNYVNDLFGSREMLSESDVLGSYTGVPTDGYDRPIQDADDL